MFSTNSQTREKANSCEYVKIIHKCSCSPFISLVFYFFFKLFFDFTNFDFWNFWDLQNFAELSSAVFSNPGALTGGASVDSEHSSTVCTGGFADWWPECGSSGLRLLAAAECERSNSAHSCFSLFSRVGRVCIRLRSSDRCMPDCLATACYRG